MSYQPTWIHQKDRILSIANDVKLANPAAWNELKIPGQESRKYINLVSIALLEEGIPGGVNLKRGGPQQSIDAIALPNDTGVADSTGTYDGIEIIDIVGGAEGPSPSLQWGDVTQATMDGGAIGGWKAGSVHDVPPQPPSQPVQPYPDEQTWWPQVFDVEVGARYARAGKTYPDGPGAFRWASRTSYDIRDGMTKEASLDKHLKELERELGLS